MPRVLGSKGPSVPRIHGLRVQRTKISQGLCLKTPLPRSKTQSLTKRTFFGHPVYKPLKLSTVFFIHIGWYKWNYNRNTGHTTSFHPWWWFYSRTSTTIIRRLLQHFKKFPVCHHIVGAMSLFTLLYVTPILGLIYYLFFWGQATKPQVGCVSF